MTKQLAAASCNQCGVNPRRPGRGCKYCFECSADTLCSTCRKEPREAGSAKLTQCRACRKLSVDNCHKAAVAARLAADLCPRCGKFPPIEGTKRCISCSDKRKGEGKANRSNVKARCVLYLGHSCKDCGYIAQHLDVYDFHHRDPNSKEFNIAHALSVPWSEVVAELDKCDLLCANCHRVRHAVQGGNGRNARDSSKRK